ncbi:MAG: acyl carrier protein [Synechococcaceae cyanobacterium SM2_3_1]|nr:acyl carrier protein [Synechococcaceae cyanobacterium SM2_3_1]
MQNLRSLPIESRRDELTKYLRERVSKSLGLTQSKSLDIDKSLSEMGLDSLVSIELRNRILKDLNIDIPLDKLLSGQSTVQLADFIFKQMTLQSILADQFSQYDESEQEIEEITI